MMRHRRISGRATRRFTARTPFGADTSEDSVITGAWQIIPDNPSILQAGTDRVVGKVARACLVRHRIEYHGINQIGQTA